VRAYLNSSDEVYNESERLHVNRTDGNHQRTDYS